MYEHVHGHAYRHVQGHVYVCMCRHVRRHVSRHVHWHVYGVCVCSGMFVGMCVGRCMDVCMDMLIARKLGACLYTAHTPLYRNMSLPMPIFMSIDMCMRCLHSCVRHVYTVSKHMPMHTHLLRLRVSADRGLSPALA